MTIEHWTDKMLDNLAEAIAKNGEQIDKNAEITAKNSEQIAKNSELINKNAEALKDLNTKFIYYQQASQWVVNLAFGLLATATITTIITAVFRK